MLCNTFALVRDQRRAGGVGRAVGSSASWCGAFQDNVRARKFGTCALRAGVGTLAVTDVVIACAEATCDRMAAIRRDVASTVPVEALRRTKSDVLGAEQDPIK